MTEIKARIGNVEAINVTIKNATISGGGLPDYEGEYTVTPLAYEAVTLPTKDKSMRQDLIVEEIPNYMVSNESGNTFIIG